MIYLAWGSVIAIAALFLACAIAASISSARETREADGTDGFIDPAGKGSDIRFGDRS